MVPDPVAAHAMLHATSAWRAPRGADDWGGREPTRVDGVGGGARVGDLPGQRGRGQAEEQGAGDGGRGGVGGHADRVEHAGRHARAIDGDA